MNPLQIVITRKSDDQYRILFMDDKGTIYDDTTGKGGILAIVETQLESLSIVPGLPSKASEG